MTNSIRIFILLLCFAGSGHTSLAQYANKDKQPLTRILFIYDASNSMRGQWQHGSKHLIAHRLISEALDSLRYEKNLELALRVYGHQKDYTRGQDCDDTKLEVPFGKNNVSAIKEKLKSIDPKGTTPIAMTLEKAADDFPRCIDCRNVIILITDGIEECGGDPCAVSLALQRQGIILKPFVIGIGLDLNFIETFKCIGNIYPAGTEHQFRNVLNTVISIAMNTTTAQVNLLDISGQPNETDVPMTFFDHISGKARYHYVHTINNRGNPDTVVLDPVPVYDLLVHTIPPVRKDSITITAGIHNIIAVDAPRGSMIVRFGGGNKSNVPVIVRKKDEMKTLNVQNTGSEEKYIVGRYDLEILTLPRTYVSDVLIKQSHQTRVDIPNPGLVTITMDAPGIASVIYLKGNNEERIYNFGTSTTRETLSLQPGQYLVSYRAKSAKETIYSIEKKFTVRSGTSQVVKIY